MDLVVAKVITALVLFVLTGVFSLIPYVIIRRGRSAVGDATSSRRRERAIAYLNCFGGGVFLSALLIHILPEGSEQFEDYKESVGFDNEFPIFNLAVAVGFFLVAIIELVAHSQLAKKHKPLKNESTELSTESVFVVATQRRHSYGAFTGSTEENAENGQNNGQDNSGLAQPNPENSKNVQKPETSGGHDVEGNQAQVEAEPVSVRAFILLIALSFHTIFDGLAVGLQESTTEVWSVFAAVTIHKSVIAFCLGLELFQSNTRKPLAAILWLGVFSIMSPLGIGIGIGLTSGAVNKIAKQLASSLLQGLAGGTFMYVTFLEILAVYIGHHGKAEVLYLVFAFIGFAMMAAVKLLDHD